VIRRAGSAAPPRRVRPGKLRNYLPLHGERTSDRIRRLTTRGWIPSMISGGLLGLFICPRESDYLWYGLGGVAFGALMALTFGSEWSSW